MALLQDLHPEDSRICIILQPGVAFRKVVDGGIYICICNLRWAVLAWPLTAVGEDGHHILDPGGELSWHFVMKKNDVQTALIQPAFLHGVGIAGVLSNWQEPLRVLLLHFSGKLVFRDLQFLATTCFEMRRTGSMTRRKLLEELAYEVGGREFAAEVLSSVPETNKRKLEEAEFDELADAIIGNMDLAEATEFNEIKESLKKKQKLEVAVKWQKWKKEARTGSLFENVMLQLFSTSIRNFQRQSLQAIDRKKAKGKGKKGKGKGRGKGRRLGFGRGRCKGSGKGGASESSVPLPSESSVPPQVPENSAARNKLRRRLSFTDCGMEEDNDDNNENDDNAFMEALEEVEEAADPAPNDTVDESMESCVPDECDTATQPEAAAGDGPVDAGPVQAEVPFDVNPPAAVPEHDGPDQSEVPLDVNAPASVLEHDGPDQVEAPLDDVSPPAVLPGHVEPDQVEVPLDDVNPPAVLPGHVEPDQVEVALDDVNAPAAVPEPDRRHDGVAPNARGPTVNKTPDDLLQIVPPCCSIHLNCTLN